MLKVWYYTITYNNILVYIICVFRQSIHIKIIDNRIIHKPSPTQTRSTLQCADLSGDLNFPPSRQTMMHSYALMTYDSCIFTAITPVIIDIATCDHDFAHFNTYISGMTHVKVFPLPATWLQDTGDISRNHQVTLDGRLQETHWRTVGGHHIHQHPAASSRLPDAPSLECSQGMAS